jgi:hypothetical protein
MHQYLKGAVTFLSSFPLLLLTVKERIFIKTNHALKQQTNKKYCISRRICKYISKTIYKIIATIRPPLWSSGQNSWLQIRRTRFDSRHYQKKKVMGLEWGSLSLVSTTEELLDGKVAAPV